MEFNKIYIVFLILIISCLFISSVSAHESSDFNLTNVKYDDNMSSVGDGPIVSGDCCADVEKDVAEILDENKTWYVEPDPDNPNQVQAPTVQPVINQANPGDRIVLNGSFVHCHFRINKTLNIIAAPGTSVGVCPHHNHPTGSNTFGIFYITPEASGTVISGFEFTNDFFSIANVQQNPFAVLIDGASNVGLKDLVVNWTGVKVNEKNPQDYVFNPILIRNAVNTTLNNLFINNSGVGINVENSTDTKIINTTVINSGLVGILIGNNSSQIEITDNKLSNKVIPITTFLTVDDLNIKVGTVGKLRITLKDENYVTLNNKNVVVMINGVSSNVTTDEKGVAILNVKYSTAATYYVTVSFLGDDYLKASVTGSKIIVSKKATILTAPKKTFKLKSSKKIAITLKSGTVAIKNKKVSLKVNGKTYSAKTNSKGIAYITVKLSKKGTFNYVAKFAGDATYKSVSKSGKIIVKK